MLSFQAGWHTPLGHPDSKKPQFRILETNLLRIWSPIADKIQLGILEHGTWHIFVNCVYSGLEMPWNVLTASKRFKTFKCVYFTSDQLEAPLENRSSSPVYVLDTTILSTRWPAPSICTRWWNYKNILLCYGSGVNTCSKSPPTCLCCSHDFRPKTQQTNPLFFVLKSQCLTRGVALLATLSPVSENAPTLSVGAKECPPWGQYPQHCQLLLSGQLLVFQRKLFLFGQETS